MKMLHEYFAEIENLISFLVERQQGYRITATGLVFERNAGAEAFNAKMDEIANLEQQMASSRQKLEQTLRQMNVTH